LEVPPKEISDFKLTLIYGIIYRITEKSDPELAMRLIEDEWKRRNE
jgi:hypothetical protein